MNDAGETISIAYFYTSSHLESSTMLPGEGILVLTRKTFHVASLLALHHPPSSRARRHCYDFQLALASFLIDRFLQFIYLSLLTTFVLSLCDIKPCLDVTSLPSVTHRNLITCKANQADSIEGPKKISSILSQAYSHTPSDDPTNNTSCPAGRLRHCHDIILDLLLSLQIILKHP
jgi:hypothetical protein